MNTVAETTRPRTRELAVGERARSLRASTRRLTTWWAADPMSARFTAAREDDQRLLQRLGR